MLGRRFNLYGGQTIFYERTRKMSVMNVEKRPERRPILRLADYRDENADGVTNKEQFDQKPPRLLNFEAESFWAGRNKAARLSARIAA